MYLGLGRRRSGRVGDGVGYNGYALRTSDAPAFGVGAQVRRTGGVTLIASTQGHHSMEGRALVRAATFEEFKKNPDFAHHMGEEAPAKTLTLYNLTAQQRERALAEHAPTTYRGAWRSIRASAPAAAPASSRATPRTTSR